MMARIQLRDEAGFSLAESMVALGVLTFGLLALAQVFTLGLGMVRTSSPDLIAREKAAEAIENVFTARDTRVITWDQIRNKVGSSGNDRGIFIDGPQPLTAAGDDGLVNTEDDAQAGVESVMTPGADNLLGTADDVARPLSEFKREIEIRDVSTNLRHVKVIITYSTPNGPREYVLETRMSSFA
jgi:hypothetical protein